MKRNRTLPLILLILASFSCKKEESAVPASIVAVPQVSPVSNASAPPLAPRMIIRNAALSLVVGDASDAIVKATRVVEANHGYVSDSKQWREASQTRASATLRIPSNALGPVMEQLRHLAIRVQSETVSSQDVSQEHVDLAAQLRNLQAAEGELRGLLTTVRQRTQKASEVLEVYAELSKVQGEIEKTQGRLEYLSQMTAFSTITLELIPDALAAPLVEPGWQPVATVRSATRSLLTTIEFLTDAGIWIVLYVLPIVLMFVIAALALRFTWLRVRIQSSADASSANRSPSR